VVKGLVKVPLEITGMRAAGGVEKTVGAVLY